MTPYVHNTVYYRYMVLAVITYVPWRTMICNFNALRI